MIQINHNQWYWIEVLCCFLRVKDDYRYVKSYWAMFVWHLLSLCCFTIFYFIKWKSIMLFHLTIRKWKSGMGYYAINMHDTEPRMHFHKWFIYTSLWLMARGWEVIWNTSDRDWEGVKGSSKIVDFLETSVWTAPYGYHIINFTTIGVLSWALSKKLSEKYRNFT